MTSSNVNAVADAVACKTAEQVANLIEGPLEEAPGVLKYVPLPYCIDLLLKPKKLSNDELKTDAEGNTYFYINGILVDTNKKPPKKRDSETR